MSKLIALLVACLMLVGLTGCNTFQGLGKDVQKGGEAVEKAAK